MATWTSFYINTDHEHQVVQKLQELTDDLEVTYDSDFPREIGDYQMFDADLPPNYLAIGKTQDGWTTIVHNSFDKMEDWGIHLSKHFHCKVIVTLAQSVSSCYYFALYDMGIKAREIETADGDEFIIANSGDKFDFEGDEPGRRIQYDDVESYYFDFDAIEEYCQHFNLTIQTDYNDVKWTVLKGKNLKSDVADFWKKHMTKKPWWKFW